MISYIKRMKYNKLEIVSPEHLVFGTAPHPVTTGRGLTIGNGQVYPELNFTLPPMTVSHDNMDEISRHYREIVVGALDRALHLECPGLVLEFETLIEMTRDPRIGLELVKLMNEICEGYYQKHGLVSEIRLTPNDLREFERPPRQRSTGLLDPMMELFEKGAEAGGTLLSIESTGGKEISDDALMMCDMKQFVFSQAVLGVRDMQMLWKKIVDVAERTGRIPGGDTACGFANTAMVLAEKGFIPKIFAAIARIATIVRSLVAFELGAMGPDKDCGYEGPFLKAIAGIPISMEGKSAACAHFSPVGNISAACADLWSNESVQNIKLLSGYAPVVSLEQLVYDTRLMNGAIRDGLATVNKLQDLFVSSDAFYDPQALILAPVNVIDISREIVKGSNHIDATVRGCLKGLDIIETAQEKGQLRREEREDGWLDTIRLALLSIPLEEDAFVEEILPTIDRGKILLEEYGL
jgi:methanol--5-hydroxybenzimidazolylcobamide Co-methyltransferase